MHLELGLLVGSLGFIFLSFVAFNGGGGGLLLSIQFWLNLELFQSEMLLLLLSVHDVVNVSLDLSTACVLFKD